MSVSVGKANKVVSKVFMDEVADLTEDEAKERLFQCDEAIVNLKAAQKNDTKLNAAKEVVKDLTAGYSSSIKNERAKRGFLVEHIRRCKDEAGEGSQLLQEQ